MHSLRLARTAPLTVLALCLAAVLAFAASSAQATDADRGSPVDPFGTYQGQVSCDPDPKPGVVATRNLLLKKFGGRDMGISRACHIGGVSEHKEGRAWDWGLNASNPADRRIANKAIAWLTKTVDGQPAANARRLGLSYAIWAGRMIRFYDFDAGWQRYTGESPHTDHIHLTFTWNGAMKRTSWWAGVPQPLDYGPCVRWVGEPAKPWTAPNLSPCPTPLERPRANKNGIYRAQHGETIKRVARFFNQTPRQIRAWNGWPATGPVLLDTGQRVQVTRPN